MAEQSAEEEETQAFDRLPQKCVRWPDSSQLAGNLV